MAKESIVGYYFCSYIAGVGIRWNIYPKPLQLEPEKGEKKKV